MMHRFRCHVVQIIDLRSRRGRRRHCRRLRLNRGQGRQAGFVIILFAAMLVPFLGMVAVVIDVGRLQLARDRLESASAKALLSAVRASERAAPVDQTTTLIETYDDALALNFGPGFVGAIVDLSRSQTITSVANEDGQRFEVRVEAELEMILIDQFKDLAGFGGDDDRTVTVSAVTAVQRYGTAEVPTYRVIN